MDIVRVKVVTTPRLLADLITAALDTPAVRPWAPGDEPALVTITNTGADATNGSRLTIVLGDRLDDPVAVLIDGELSSVPATRPDDLRDLVLDLARALTTPHDGVVDESCG